MVGIETYGVQENKSMAILSFCSNTNRECTTFHSNFIVHPKTEIGKTHMSQIIIECLSEYIKLNNRPPSDVILLKNGSTKYDNNLVIQAEVSETKEVFKSLYKNNSTKLVYLLLDVKTNQKFFKEAYNGVSNPQSGMLVNSEIVGDTFEFYLIAQNCNRGTARPTFYKAVHNNSNL